MKEKTYIRLVNFNMVVAITSAVLYDYVKTNTLHWIIIGTTGVLSLLTVGCYFAFHWQRSRINAQ